MEMALRSSALTAEFVTHHHRISARVDVHQFKLADQLNSRVTDFIHLEDVYVSNIEQPAAISACYQDAFVRKTSILAVIVPREEDALPRDHAYGTYMTPVPFRVYMTVPTFEIRGTMLLPSRMDLRVVLTTGTVDFVPILNAEMLSAVRQDMSYSSVAILVSKQHIEVFWVEKEAHPTDGQNPSN